MQYVWDDRGNKYLDLHTGHGAAFLGHRNPYVIEEIRKQLDKIVVTPLAYDSDTRDQCLEMLDKILPKNLRNVFFQNSGTEAVELALKIAKKVTRRRKIIAFKNSFHGRTLGALMVTWNPKYRKPFFAESEDVVFLRFNCVFDVERFVDEGVAAVVVEVVQGEGGLNVATPEFLKAIREKCGEVGCVTIFDEVQTGFGRTGKTWAHQHYNIEPDILVAGKAIGGGFPVSLVVTSSEIGESLELGEHGTTYGGNPVACAAVSASIDVLLEDDVADKARAAGEYFRKKLSEIVSREKLKGLGLMIGIDIGENPEFAIKSLLNEKIISLKAGETVLRFLPPYMITKEDIEHIVEALNKVLRKESYSS